MKIATFTIIIIQIVSILSLSIKSRNAILANNTKNVTGIIANSSLEMSSRPYTIHQCDQIILFKGSRITDFNDYTKQKSSHFSLNAYLLNVFDEKIPEKLVDSVNINQLLEEPKKMQGMKKCLYFKGEKTEIGVCLPDEEETDEVYQAYRSLIACSKGKTESPCEKEIKKRLEELKMQNSTYNNGKVNLQQQSIFGVNQLYPDIEKPDYYHDLRVPGSNITVNITSEERQRRIRNQITIGK